MYNSSFIDTPSTLLNWIKALKLENYPTLNDLGLLPELAAKAEIEEVSTSVTTPTTNTKLFQADLWPALVLRNRLDYNTSLLLNRVSSLFATIRFCDWLDIDSINTSITSSKPIVELHLTDRSTADFKILSACLANSRINKIHLEGMTDRKLDLISSSLLKSPSTILTAFELFGILTEKSMAVFAEMLKVSSLKVLKLNGRLDEESLLHLSKALPFSKVQELVLTECSIGKESAQALADGIVKSQLRDLFLDDNDLDDDAMTALATCIQESQLTNINFSDSCLSSRGIIAVSNALPQSKVVELDFYGNSDVV